MNAKHMGCAAAVALFLSGCAVAPETNRSVVVTSSGSAVAAPDASRFAAILNRYRAQKGRQPLAPNPELTRAARSHAIDMARRDYFSHRGKDGSLPQHRIKRAGYRGCATGENLAFGQPTVADAFRAWVKSPGHNRILLYRDFEEYGFARYGRFWVLNVGRRC